MTTSTCPCNAGYYDNGSAMCQTCVSPCMTCSGNSTLNCTSCFSGYRLIGSSCNKAVICSKYYYMGYCVDSCPNTTYPLLNNCAVCTNNCLTCLSANVCTSCPNPYLLSNGSCLGSCPTGTYAFAVQCLSCPKNCSSCVYRQSVICLSCASNYYLTSNLSCDASCNTSQTHVLI